MKKHIPNSLTLVNLFCGALGIVFVFQDKPMWAFAAMLVGAFFDFLDGFVARALKVSGKLGAELDSMADMVTFGTLPAMMLYKLFLSVEVSCSYTPYLALLIAVFSGLRLAKFNISETQSSNFVGLPTPMNAIFIASFTFTPFDLLKNEYVLIAITLFSAYLLNSNFKIIALKFEGFGFKENLDKWILIALSIIFIFLLQIAAIPLILLVYLILSYLHFYLKLF